MTTSQGPDGGTVDALQRALATEHAALWSYGLALAFLPTDRLATARTDLDTHQQLRGVLEQLISVARGTPAPALPTYRPPRPVTDGPSAAALLALAESDALAAWRSVLEHTADRALRQRGLAALTAGTARAARWRAVAGDIPAIPQFPGQG